MSNIIEFNQTYHPNHNSNIIINNSKLKNDLLLSNHNNNDINNDNFLQNKTISLKNIRKYIIYLNDKNFILMSLLLAS